MITVRQVREDLKEIKYYYARKDKIDEASANMGANEIYKKVEKYNKAICKAPLRMFDLYVGLYQQNNTLESLADSICYSFEYVAKLNQKMVKFFEKTFSEEEKGE